MTLDRFEGLLDKVETKFERASSNISLETKQYANRRLTEITPDLQRISRPNAYQDFLLDQIQAEKEKFQLAKRFDRSDAESKAEFLADEYYEELREDPVCTCDGKHAHKCVLKRGKLPIEVRNADNIDEGIREFRAEHNGRPLVLVDAQDEFAAFVGEVEAELRELIAVLTTDEIPDDAASTDADTQPTGQTAD
ncbi:hypothetical protein [Halobaculum magnesiiphilum]|uniref:Uncharacterized protein n=1 Tax=Halobaculum magnesiiphilum TaxID=1017351 RepID=A0A8T8WB52_9EURY|nr:hypothetical protein [Halobaculum magnesiiphilum]QZP37079.1 hypothetical protein K6T50_12375 [Halobaculum magnesiiphilum]